MSTRNRRLLAGCVAAASPLSSTARWRSWPRSSASTSCSSIAVPAPVPACSPSTTRSSPTRSTGERSHSRREEVDQAEFMMNICSTCQGAQSESQERLDANAEYRHTVNHTLAQFGLSYEKGIVNKNFLWVLVEDIAPRRAQVARRQAAHRSQGRPFYAATSCAPSIASASTRTTRATRNSRR